MSLLQSGELSTSPSFCGTPWWKEWVCRMFGSESEAKNSHDEEWRSLSSLRTSQMDFLWILSTLTSILGPTTTVSNVLKETLTLDVLQSELCHLEIQFILALCTYLNSLIGVLWIEVSMSGFLLPYIS